MAADSLVRRLVKRGLAPFLNEYTYQGLQALAMAYDIWSGSWKEPELELIEYAVREGETTLDIGANYGLYSFYLSKAVGRNGKVYAFEPISFTAGVFRKVARLLRLNNVQLIEKGCGEQPGRAQFNVPFHATGTIMAGQVHHSGRNNERAGRECHARFTKTKQVDCEIIRIDDQLPVLSDVSFLKCDIEGADLYALRGAASTLQHHRPLVVCEINPWFLEGYGLAVSDLTSFFSALGYELYRYQNGLLKPKSASDVEEDNWIFMHPSRFDRMRALLSC